MRFLSGILLVVFICKEVVSEELPSDFKKCSIKDKTCLKVAIEDAIQKLAGGINSLDVPPLDPLQLEKVSIASGKIVQLVQNYDKLDVIGLSTLKVDDLSFEMDKGKMVLDLSGAKLELKGTYSVRGKILVLDVYGTGPSIIRLDNFQGKVDMDVQKYEKNGETYIKVTKLGLQLNPKNVYYQFDNLFDGNRALGDNINNVLNDNWKEIYDELKGGYFKAVSAGIMEVTNKLFEKIPFKYIFLA